MEQSYEKHAHHPVPSYVAGFFALLAIILLVGAWLFGWATRDAGMVSLALAVAVLVSISRQYIVRLQDRIILLEMKVRAADVLNAEQEALVAKLRPKQIVALRFASDAELGALVERAARDQLPPDEIKRAVQNWRADHLRT